MLLNLVTPLKIKTCAMELRISDIVGATSFDPKIDSSRERPRDRARDYKNKAYIRVLFMPHSSSHYTDVMHSGRKNPNEKYDRYAGALRLSKQKVA